MNPFDILGSLMNGRMGPSAGRLERTFGNEGFGGPGGMFGGGPGGMPRGAPGGMPGGGPGGMFGGAPSGSPGGMPGAIFDMLGKMAGSVFGGGASGAPGVPRSGSGGGFSTDVVQVRKAFAEAQKVTQKYPKRMADVFNIPHRPEQLLETPPKKAATS